MVLFAKCLTTAVVALLLWGAVTDVRVAKIPNWLVVVGLVLAPLAALVGGGLTGFFLALTALAIAFFIGLVGFAIGAIGGGDAKFLMVGAALVGLPQLMPYLLVTAALGGVLALGLVAWGHRGIEATIMTKDLAMSMATLGRKGYRGRLGEEGRLAVPYGVAIAAGALIVHFTSFTEWLLG
jgi:prepilin peptidase CpaA